MTDQEKLKLIEISMTEVSPTYVSMLSIADSIKQVSDLNSAEIISKLDEAAKLLNDVDDMIVDITYDVDLDYDALRERGEFKLKTQEGLKESHYTNKKIDVAVSGTECEFTNVPVTVRPKDSRVPWDGMETDASYTADIDDLFSSTQDLEDEYVKALLVKRGITEDNPDYQNKFNEVLDNEVYNYEYDVDVLEEVIDRLMNVDTDKDLIDYVIERVQDEAQQEIDDFDPDDYYA